MLRQMYVLLISLITLSAVPAFANGGTDLFTVAWETKQNIDARLNDCGTSRLDPDDSRLPFRQVPAHEALANVELPWFFGYFYRNGGEFKWKRPNGGAVAWMQLIDDDRISFGTSLGGTVARISKFYTPWGPRFNYWCGSYQVDEATLRQCVETYWINPLLSNFCRS